MQEIAKERLTGLGPFAKLCQTLRIFANLCESLRIFANRCESLRIVADLCEWLRLVPVGSGRRASVPALRAVPFALFAAGLLISRASMPALRAAALALFAAGFILGFAPNC